MGLGMHIVPEACRARRARAHLVVPLCFAAVAGLMLVLTSSASAQSREAIPKRSMFDELRIGLMAHHVEPAGTEKGLDLNFEVLFARPAIAYGNAFADIVLRPRLHVGTSINLAGDTSQVYAGFTWDMPLHERVFVELSFGGALHDGPENDDDRSSFGCALNFRESASIGYAVTDRWRLYGTVMHMSNAGLCERNSGLTSAGIRLGYRIN
jgi:lipid A 3-O-deacylase